MILSSVSVLRICCRREREIKMLEQETLFILVHIWCYANMPQMFKKWAKPYFKVFLRKSLNFRTKIKKFLNTYNFKNALVSYMNHL